MPAPQIELILEGLLLSEIDLGAVFIRKGVEYPCTAGPIFGGKRLDQGGFRTQARCIIKVRTEVFAEGQQPQEREIVQLIQSPNFDPVTLRIDAIHRYYGYFLEIHCEDPNRAS